MEYRYKIHTFKCVIAALVAVMFVVLGIVQIILCHIFTAAFLMSLGIFFFWISIANGSTVLVNADGVALITFGHIRRFFSWDSIQEVGVTGTKVFNRHSPSKTGTVFIYFSRSKMTKDDRFKMILNWPPKEKIYFQFSMDKLAAVERYWTKEIALNNIGNIPL